MIKLSNLNKRQNLKIQKIKNLIKQKKKAQKTKF